jgi:hypothetical protein
MYSNATIHNILIKELSHREIGFALDDGGGRSANATIFLLFVSLRAPNARLDRPAPVDSSLMDGCEFQQGSSQILLNPPLTAPRLSTANRWLALTARKGRISAVDQMHRRNEDTNRQSLCAKSPIIASP